MTNKSHRKGNSGTTQKPSERGSSATINAPGIPVDNPRVPVDADGVSPPAYPGSGPLSGLAQTLALTSTRRAIGYYPIVDSDVPEVAIAVMGATGSGKSTFINLVSGSALGVGGGLRSCTNAVQLGNAFDLDGRRVVLIDTPGFDDTTLSDTDILKMIAAFLAISYRRGSLLAGVIYFHRISDVRVGGIAAKNFNMFRKLCGDTALRNVIIATNRWGEVDPQVGAAREEELKSDDLFFKPILDEGARMARHENTVSSAEKIIRLILDNDPLPLRIQEELVDEHKNISETGAGEELNREINAQIKKHQEEMGVLRRGVGQAAREKDEKTRKELETETQKMQREIARFKNDARRLVSDYENEKERLEDRFEQVEIEAVQEADRIAAQLQQQFEELKQTLEANAAAAERDRAAILEQINELFERSARPHHSGGGFFSRIGAAIDRIVVKIIPLWGRR